MAPQPAGKPAGKPGGMKKLPPWAWVAAAGVGIILGLFLFRRGSLTPSQPDQATQPDQGPQEQQGAGPIAPEFIPFDWLSAIGAYFTPPSSGGGGATGGGESGGASEVSSTTVSGGNSPQPTLPGFAAQNVYVPGSGYVSPQEAGPGVTVAPSGGTTYTPAVGGGHAI